MAHTNFGLLPENMKTTHNATYILPKLMPTYRGHCPCVKFDYGQTYGTYTCKQFQDYRSTVLQSSMTPYKDSGNFPTIYSHNPKFLWNKRVKSHERYSDRFCYQLYNKDNYRSDELRNFEMDIQKHREYYLDKTGTKKPVPAFLIPLSDAQFIKDKYSV
ncbi:unnamed protein product [Schistosoma mattheei]|uniref:Ciliary microtubule inner protein 2C n=1 Tax=Schistosoma mattheei TaxID=31246 RepID=A0AA85BY84_9TREM|nr:unnamed protein product [Schistosoma mattheei]